MKVLQSWLEEFVPIKLDAEQLASELSLKSVEVNAVERPGSDIDEDVVVGLVTDVRPHPNADRLKLATIDSGKGTVEVVCGASNITKGLKVAFAPVGTELYDPDGKRVKLTPAKIRGVLSHGMACAAGELGVGDAFDSLIILDPKAKVGVPVREQFGNDAVFDLEVLSNRGDLMGHRGIAREISAITKTPMKGVKIELPKPETDGLPLTVNAKGKDICSRYTALVLSGLAIADSPPLIQQRLRAVGIRPINNIVDATNYFMMHFGYPFHAFDYDLIKGAGMIIRGAIKGEEVTTIDEQTWKLEAGMPIIEDTQRIIDLAGIMGGANSGVNNRTKRIILQSAVFDATLIRRTSRTLGHRTDAVSVYEKGIDPEGTLEVLAHAYHELREMMPEIKLERIIDIYPSPVKRDSIELEADHTKRLLGQTIEVKDIEEVLSLIGCTVKKKGKTLDVVPPSYRLDLTIPEDIIEEIGRLTGYDKLPETLPQTKEGAPRWNHRLHWQEEIKDVCVSAGFTEVVIVSLTGKKVYEPFGLAEKDHIALTNPMTPDHAFLQRSLIPGLISVARDNLRYTNDVALFECGHIFIPGEKQHEERSIFSAVLTSNLKTDEPFYRTKGVIEGILNHLNLSDVSSSAGKVTHAGIDGRRVIFTSGKTTVAEMAEIDPYVLGRLKVKRRVISFTLFLDELLPLANNNVVFKPLPIYPPARRDVAFWVKGNVAFKDIQKTILTTDKLLKSAELFDEYRKDNKMSYAFHLVYQSDTRTLTGDEVDKLHKKVILNLESKHGVEVRK